MRTATWVARPRAERPGRREPARTCVGCRTHGGKRALLRVVRTPAGEVVLDPGQRAPGRGAYLHEDPECARTARRRRALERALRIPIPEAVWEAVAARLAGER
jgi:uncharacterized protein